MRDAAFEDFRRLGFPSRKVERYMISMGALTLPDDLPKGKARELTPDELAALKCENS